MTINESACVALKRQGAEHVARLLSGKSKAEQLEFWRKRTEDLLMIKRSAHASDQPINRS